MTLIYAKFDPYLINISEVASRKTKWPRFFLPTRYIPQNQRRQKLNYESADRLLADI